VVFASSCWERPPWRAVILVEQIEAEPTAGLAGWDAVIAAAESRMRPILLSAATVLAMIPIAPTVFWGPMAFAVMGGFAAATVLTLLFLPALYVAWFGIREPVSVEFGPQRSRGGQRTVERRLILKRKPAVLDRITVRRSTVRSRA